MYERNTRRWDLVERSLLYILSCVIKKTLMYTKLVIGLMFLSF